MIQQIENLPDNMVGFRATGEVTKDDYENTLLPAVKKIVEKHGKLNYLFVLDTPITKFTPAAWMMDAWLGIKNMFKWHRGAFVTDSDEIIKLTNGFTHFIPGEFKGFKHTQMQTAIDWVSGKTD